MRSSWEELFFYSFYIIQTADIMFDIVFISGCRTLDLIYVSEDS